MMQRRSFLQHAGSLGLLGLTGTLASVRHASAADYKAVVVVYLSGGYDGNNALIPTDGAYSDYSRARPSLALPKDSLVGLSGTHIGHSFALSPAMRPLAELFEQKRLAVIANAGALVAPTTMSQYRERSVKLPPFMGSHSEQQSWVQGWMGDANRSGWGGRTMDLLAPQGKQPLVAMTSDYTAVFANQAPLSLANSGSNSNWGNVNLLSDSDLGRQQVEWVSRMQSGNAYEREFAHSLRVAYLDSIEFAKGQMAGLEPTGNFPDVSIGRDLRYLARHLQYSKMTGATRQIYLVQDGGYDTHSGQLNTGETNPGLERMLSNTAASVAALDQSIRSAGMDGEVTIVIMSEFGRTLSPTDTGSDHAWGNHWFALGGMVQGGKVYGDSFPSLQVGGPDDASWEPRRGWWLPQYSSDQFVADFVRWMGLTPEQTQSVMPNLANFKRQTIGYI